ncbi:VanZ family protein [Xanthobacter dioxanivorans]|uniref:VanZ family protein n=1 Tax=Xanthobacter dioxanivorans TaxID=2528964 RepID=A0A974SH02_9HYPH|nr:VanZ family protein [Xanthobacter dioxanivorans]QRG04599.1 VanZ family protein [Xanthobacter dioxanivorans]
MLHLLLRHETRIWTVLAVALWMVIAILSLLPGSERPHTGYSGNLEHVAAYLGAATVTALAFRAVPLLWLVLPFSIASAVFEVVQLAIPGRTSLVENWAASTLGALIGVLAARRVARPLLDRLIAAIAAPAARG